MSGEHALMLQMLLIVIEIASNSAARAPAVAETLRQNPVSISVSNGAETRFECILKLARYGTTAAEGSHSQILVWVSHNSSLTEHRHEI